MEERQKKIYHRVVLKIVFLFTLSLILFGYQVLSASAASLYLSPASGTYTVGQNFTVNIMVSSPGEAANAYSGKISFSADTLQITSLSKGGSIVNLWVQDPSYSNGNGIINFEGITLNPGFTGSSGKILSIGFKVKAVGPGAVVYTAGSVLANDGEGTNILSGLINANFNIKSPTQPAEPKTEAIPAIINNAPGAPFLSSPTHPNEVAWYSNANPQIIWPIPSGVTGVSYLLNNTPGGVVGTKSDGVVGSYQSNNLADGKWYFKARLKNKLGWGDTAKFVLQIDTVAPKQFGINFVKQNAFAYNSVAFTARAQDDTSGVSYYTVKIDSADPITVTPSDIEAKPYVVTNVSHGKHTLMVRAYDYAGNNTISAEDFTVSGISPPEFTDYPTDLPTNSYLVARGLTLPSSNITVYLRKNLGGISTIELKSNADGRFTLVTEDKLSSGMYKITALVTTAEGVKSDESRSIIVYVSEPTFIKIGRVAVSYLAALVPLVGLILLLIIMFGHSYKKYKSLKERIHKDVLAAEGSLHSAFATLRKNLKKQLRTLEGAETKRQLTREEVKISDQIKRDIELLESLVKKEIEEIDKEVK